MGKVAKDVTGSAADVPAPTRPPRHAGTGSLAVGVPVSAVLDVPSLAGARVLAGHRGLERMVRRLNVMEVPDILPWVKPDELLLTTGYPLRHDPQALTGLVAELDERGLAALAVKVGRYLDELPAAALAEADRRGLPIVTLAPHIGFDEIITDVLTDVLDRQAAVLARSEEVHRALVRIVLDGGEVDEVAAELARLLSAAVLVMTPDGRVVSRAGPDAELAALRDASCLEAGGRFRTERERVGLSSHDGLAGNHILVPIVAGGVDHGRIVAWSSDGRLAPGDVHVLERGATVAALAVTKQLAVHAVESKYQGDFLRDVLTRRVPKQRAIDQGRSLGWDLERPMVVVVAELDPAPAGARGSGPALRPVAERFATAWQTVVRPRDARAPVAGFTEEVVAVLGVPSDGDVARLVRDLVSHVSGDGGGGRRSFSTGVSRVCDAAGLPQAYELARKAAQVGRRTHGPGAVAHFDELGVYRLLSLVEDGAELKAFVHETLGALAGDDVEHADLRRTLEVLLDQNLNVAETARLLHFHYNTLRYRIAKLERMLGPFTGDPNLRLNVMVALAATRMRGL